MDIYMHRVVKIELAKRFISNSGQRVLRITDQARRFEANKAKALRINLRFFRRYAARIMAREAA